jgi:hypothetical protein
MAKYSEMKEARPCPDCKYFKLLQRFASQITELTNESGSPTGNLYREALKPWVYADAMNHFLEIEARLTDLGFLVDGNWSGALGYKKKLVDWVFILSEKGFLLKKKPGTTKLYSICDYRHFFCARYGHKKTWIDGMSKHHHPKIDEALSTFFLIDFKKG